MKRFSLFITLFSLFCLGFVFKSHAQTKMLRITINGMAYEPGTTRKYIPLDKVNDSLTVNVRIIIDGKDGSDEAIVPSYTLELRRGEKELYKMEDINGNDYASIPGSVPLHRLNPRDELIFHFKQWEDLESGEMKLFPPGMRKVEINIR